MQITGFRCHLIETPAGIRLSSSYGASPTMRGHVQVQLLTDEGIEGWGEASPLTWFTGETPETIKEILESHWLSLLIGEDPHDIPKIHRKLSQDLAANSSARAAIDMALHDLCARAADLPLYKYLGSNGAPTLPRTYALGISDTATAIAEARRWVKKGYHTLKLKVGGDLGTNVERVAAVREAVGPHVRIRVDANAGYELKGARRLIRALEPFDLELVEQPLPAWDYEGWRALRRAVDVPLMADESLNSPQDALQLVKERLVDYFIIKLIKTGGIHHARHIAAIAETADVECIVSTPFDTEIGAAAVMHLAFSVGSREHAHDLPPLSVESEHTVGRIHPPRGPGLAVAGTQNEEVSWAVEEAD
ncbi:MAG: dipeptide epimerase [Chloroflexota bacterium]|nr:dipeptide epimerase [Chloroflexota bacterium]